MESILSRDSLKILHQLQGRVGRLKSLYRLAGFVEAALFFAVLVFGALVAGIAVQIFFNSPPRWASILFCLGELAALFFLVRRFVVPYFKADRVDSFGFSLDIEKRLPELQDRLASAIGLGQRLHDIPKGRPLAACLRILGLFNRTA